jgi:hypothetical protein
MATKIFILIFSTLVLTITAQPQATASTAEVVIVYSQNEKFYLRSIPYDNEYPSSRGITNVYEKGHETPLYSFERGFDSVERDSNNLVLSDDGQIIFYVIPWGANEKDETLKSITVYKQGKLVKTYTASEVTGCDLTKKRCDLVYSNFREVVDEKLSNFGSAKYKRVFKPGVNEQEKFLNDFALFSDSNKFYLVDSNKKMHTFDLLTGSLTESLPFHDAFEQIKGKGRFNKVEIVKHSVPFYPDFPKLKDGSETAQALAKFIGMKAASNVGSKDEKFRLYNIEIETIIARDGSVSIDKIEIEDGLPKEKILDFFKSNKFALDGLPIVFPKWRYTDYLFFRKSDDNLARKEKSDQEIVRREELQKRLIAEKIGDQYIPKDLGDAFLELDKELPEVDRTEMAALKSRKDMITYHHGLGTWLRNNWGLWGGSRLQKYFTDKGILHPDDMSSVVLFYYWDWLKGNKDSWKEWEKNPKQKIF